MKFGFLGAYDPAYPRNAVIRKGLAALGDEVAEYPGAPRLQGLAPLPDRSWRAWPPARRVRAPGFRFRASTAFSSPSSARRTSRWPASSPPSWPSRSSSTPSPPATRPRSSTGSAGRRLRSMPGGTSGSTPGRSGSPTSSWPIPAPTGTISVAPTGCQPPESVSFPSATTTSSSTPNVVPSRPRHRRPSPSSSSVRSCRSTASIRSSRPPAIVLGRDPSVVFRFVGSGQTWARAKELAAAFGAANCRFEPWVLLSGDPGAHRLVRRLPGRLRPDGQGASRRPP